MDNDKRQILEAGGFSVEDMLGAVPETLLDRFYGLFLADGSFAAFEENLKAGNYEAAKAHLHSLKGASGSICAKDLFAAAKAGYDEMVRALREGGAQGDITPSNLAAIEAAYEAAVSAVKKAGIAPVTK